MKTFSVIFLSFILLGETGILQGQTATGTQQLPSPTPYAVTSRDADSSVWQRETYEQDSNGQIIPRLHSYTELASGLNYLSNGQWTASEEEIDILPQGGASATQGQHQAYFPGDIYQGEIEDVTPDGVQLQSRPLGLGYFDGTNTVLIAVLTNSVGVQTSPNQVIYPDAFVGVDADVQYTYTKAGFEQDIILRAQPPVPETFGLVSQNTRLQVMTEFFNAPQAKVTAAMAGSLPDQNLDFGVTRMVPGKAFLMGTNSPSVPVGKQWVQIQGRQFLIEEIPVAGVAAALDSLPPPTALNKQTSLPVASRQLVLPPQHLAKNVPAARPMQQAKASLPAHGLVLDYVTVSGSLPNYTFQGDTTYYFSGGASLTGTVTVEGGAVIKYTNSVWVLVDGENASVVSKAGPDQMAVFTSKDDDSVGQPISGSTHSPVNTGSTYLALSLTSVASTLANLRFEYAGKAINQAMGNGSINCNDIWNCQFINCSIAIGDTPNYNIVEANQFLYNVLFSQCETAVNNNIANAADGGQIDLVGENVTADQVDNLLVSWSGDYYATYSSLMENSILTDVQNQIYFDDTDSSTSISTSHCCITNSGAGVYADGPLGDYYLPTNSLLIDAGDKSAAAAGLGTFTTQSNQMPDTGTVDLGYHYPVVSSAGTDFWLMFFNMYTDHNNRLSVNISSPAGVSGTVTIPGLGISTNFTVAAGAVTNISIPLDVMTADYDVVETNGIHVTASQPVSVYALDYDPYASAAFTAYPTVLLGTNYCLMAYPGDSGPSEFSVAATEDGTTVWITPSTNANLQGYDGSIYTNAYSTNLNQGQTYQIASDFLGGGGDVTGTLIGSDKPVAVFAGAYLAQIPEFDGASNPLDQEQLPVEDWGTQALSMGFAGRTDGDTYRVLATYSNTVVNITSTNGTTVITNQAGQFFETNGLGGPVEFQASQPIQVAHFGNGSYFDSPPSVAENPYEADPCEILLPPTGHYLMTNIIVTLTNDLPDNIIGDFDENFLNLIVPQSATNTTSLDGSVVAATNFVAIGSSGYYGAQITITNSGTHTVGSSQPVGVEVYGWGEVDAYGYFGGIVK